MILFDFLVYFSLLKFISGSKVHSCNSRGALISSWYFWMSPSRCLRPFSYKEWLCFVASTEAVLALVAFPFLLELFGRVKEGLLFLC